MSAFRRLDEEVHPTEASPTIEVIDQLLGFLNRFTRRNAGMAGYRHPPGLLFEGSRPTTAEIVELAVAKDHLYDNSARNTGEVATAFFASIHREKNSVLRCP